MKDTTIDNSDALTFVELREKYPQFSRDKLRARINYLVKQDRAEVVTKIIIDSTGRKLPVPAYRIFT